MKNLYCAIAVNVRGEFGTTVVRASTLLEARATVNQIEQQHWSWEVKDAPPAASFSVVQVNLCVKGTAKP